MENEEINSGLNEEAPLTPEELLALDRTLAYIPEVDNNQSQQSQPDNKTYEDDSWPIFVSSILQYEYVQDTQKRTPNLITSFHRPNGQAHVSYLNHLPVLDLDFPCDLVPSTRPGHFHLYLNKPILWDTYKELLVALAKAGIIEQGYADASIKKGFTAVRIPGATKPNIPQTAFKLLRENAILRMRNRILQKKLEQVD